MRLLFIGDVVGRPGREGLAKAMPELRAERMPDLIVVNGENAAGGVGITEETAKDLFEAGADVITLGNHAYRHREVYGYLGSEQRIVRPANFHQSNPGRGHTIVDAAGMRVAVISLSGQMHLQVERNPFPKLDRRDAVRDADQEQRHEKWVSGRPRRTTTTSANPARTR